MVIDTSTPKVWGGGTYRSGAQYGNAFGAFEKHPVKEGEIVDAAIVDESGLINFNLKTIDHMFLYTKERDVEDLIDRQDEFLKYYQIVGEQDEISVVMNQFNTKGLKAAMTCEARFVRVTKIENPDGDGQSESFYQTTGFEKWMNQNEATLHPDHGNEDLQPNMHAAVILKWLESN